MRNAETGAWGQKGLASGVWGGAMAHAKGAEVTEGQAEQSSALRGRAKSWESRSVRLRQALSDPRIKKSASRMRPRPATTRRAGHQPPSRQGRQGEKLESEISKKTNENEEI